MVIFFSKKSLSLNCSDTVGGLTRVITGSTTIHKCLLCDTGVACSNHRNIGQLIKTSKAAIFCYIYDYNVPKCFGVRARSHRGWGTAAPAKFPLPK